MANSFNYLGKTFTPTFKHISAPLLGQQLLAHTIRLISEYSTKDGYSWEDFYTAARKAGCANSDTFHMAGVGDIEFLPCGGDLYKIENITSL